ncbi:D-lactate dehydrogenase [Pseudoalteromonas fenneropenaei]|uniref:D-lactate dehydrogenase n=1 Tax=Pseudoalteromonas fenneropenaei TaxID=1737459 RepID=A0ABV7CJE3_9GAMM
MQDFRDTLLNDLSVLIGKRNVITDQQKIQPYATGFRVGQGTAIAVIKPRTLLMLWQVLQLLVKTDVAIVMQAANTGLTGGSTPAEGMDRDTVIINTLALTDIQLLPEQQQFVAFAGASLFALEKVLDPHGRVPHSVIGSSCIGASIVGGVCNNSGGALVERGPAYTELALYAQLDEHGELHLVNELDIALGETPEEILENLQAQRYQLKDIKTTAKKASDGDYKTWLRDTQSPTPARFNADPRRLHQASGCAGKLAVFAVRLDSFAKPEQKTTLLISTNSAACLTELRRDLLEKMHELPISAEYLHRDVIDLTDHYGRDTMLILKHFGTSVMPRFFNLKKSLEQFCQKFALTNERTIDWLSNRMARLLPSQVPDYLQTLKSEFEHHLILTVKGHSLAEVQTRLTQLSHTHSLAVKSCNDAEAKQVYLLRFAAAGAAIQYQKLHHQHTSGLLALDIALPRNCQDWFERLPKALSEKIAQRYYYGHFLCYVFHQDYIVKAGFDPDEVKAELLAFIDSRGAEYPAEHNVGHLYLAKPALAAQYQKLDPTNRFNPGIGKMSKQKCYGVCQHGDKQG